MSHNLQSAECQTVLRVLPPRAPEASGTEARRTESARTKTIRFQKHGDPPKSPAPPGPADARVPVGIKTETPSRERETEHPESLPLRVGIFGRGRLGSAVLERSQEAKGIAVAWALGRGYTPRGPVDVALDASRGEAVREHVEWALKTGTDLVIGTSGWSIPDLRALVGDRIGVLTAPNFSLGAALLRRFSLALGRFAAEYPESDLGISERHHRNKADAPSGTAKALADALVEGCPRYDRWGLAPAEPGMVSVSSLRTGYEIGYHEVLLDAPAETITLTHTARTRDLFARGALEAVRWIRGRKGLYSFDDLAAELIDPLFLFEGNSGEALR